MSQIIVQCVFLLSERIYEDFVEESEGVVDSEGGRMEAHIEINGDRYANEHSLNHSLHCHVMF